VYLEGTHTIKVEYQQASKIFVCIGAGGSNDRRASIAGRGIFENIILLMTPSGSPLAGGEEMQFIIIYF